MYMYIPCTCTCMYLYNKTLPKEVLFSEENLLPQVKPMTLGSVYLHNDNNVMPDVHFMLIVHLIKVYTHHTFLSLSRDSLALSQMGCPYNTVQKRSILAVLKDSLNDRPSQDGQDMAENEVRYKLIIDPSEDDSLIRLLFSLGVLDRQNTRMYVCSDFPGDSQIQKVR